MTLETLAYTVIGGLIGGTIVSWRTWWNLAVDYRRHGFDNHLCDVRGGCR